LSEPATKRESPNPDPSIDERLAAAGLPALPRTAWIEVDADGLVANLAAIRRLVGRGVRVEPVVKADAYGHGGPDVARILEAAGADGFGVATLDEGLELRAAGVRAPILVLYPIPLAGLDAARSAALDLTAGTRPMLDELLARLATTDGIDRGAEATTVGLELEVETGLGRGGIAADDLVSATRAVVESPSVRWNGLWTHFQAPEDPERTAAQVARFEGATRDLEAAGLPVPRRHASASGGLLTGAPAYDVVRPGLVTYGLVPDELVDRALPRAADDLRPALSLHARPVRVVDLEAGHGISYGPTFTTERPTRVATIPVGYADGWPRSLSNRGEALVRGCRVPYVGNVAMDAVMADVTDVPGPPVTEADEVVLIGAQGRDRITAHEVARWRTTNAWEVVTSLSRRLPRVYHAAVGPIGVRTLVPAEERWLESSSGTATSATSRWTPS
jgi:alanine racemase